MRKPIEISSENVQRVVKHISESFELYCRQREGHGGKSGIDEAYQVAEWMYSGGTHRGTWDAERKKWVPRYVAGKSNVGNLLFHRQVKTLAGSLGQVLFSGGLQWRYTTISGNSDQLEQARVATAEEMNAIARAVARLDELDRKLLEFSVNIFKLSNVFAIIGVNRARRKVTQLSVQAKPTGALTPDGSHDVSVTVKPVVKEAEEIPYPTVVFPYPANVYADINVKNMQDQNCVIVLTPTSRNALEEEREWFDENAYGSIKWEEVAWNGEYGVNPDDIMSVERQANKVLRWDAYVRVCMDDNGNVVESSGQTKLFWVTLVGNTLSDAVCLRCVSDFDPDGEIPVQIIRAEADDNGTLYHTFISEVLRPMYSARSAILNSVLDHDAVTADPPLEIMIGAHEVKDFSYRPGQRWFVSRPGAITAHHPPGNPLESRHVLEMIEEDMRLAMATDPSKMGQYAGARTTAVEIMRVTAATDSAMALRNTYIVDQLFSWIGRKYVSYIRRYMPPQCVAMLVGSPADIPPQPKYVGEYEFVVDIVGRHMDDQTRRMITRDVMTMLLSNPVMIRSDTHKLNVGELVREILRDAKLPVDRIVEGNRSVIEAEAHAKERAQLMLVTGVYVPPNEGEDLESHVRIMESEIVRWRGAFAPDDPRAKNLNLLQQYVDDCRRVMSAQAATAMAGAMALASAMRGGGGQPPQVVEGMSHNEGVEAGRALAGYVGGNV